MSRRGEAQEGIDEVLRGRGRCRRVWDFFSHQIEEGRCGERRGEDIPQEAPNHMLEQAYSLLIDKLRDHIGEHGAYGVEALICLADILQAHVVEQNLLNDEDGDGFAKFRAGLHDTET